MVSYDDKPSLIAAIRAIRRELPDTFTMDEPLLRLGIDQLSIIGWHRSAVIAALVDSLAHRQGQPRFTMQGDFKTYVRVKEPVIPEMMTPPVERNFECRNCQRRVYCGDRDTEAGPLCDICQRREWIAIMIAEEDRLFTRP